MNKDYFEIHDLTKAYLGDAIYSKYVREYIVKHHEKIRVNEAHHFGTQFEKASSQSKALMYLKNAGILTDHEWQIARKARNKTSQTRAKNASIKEYKNATGIEALVAVLYLNNETRRLEELFEIIMRGEYT